MANDDIAKKAEFDRALSAARVFRIQGDYSKAAEMVAKAISADPENPDAYEFAADILYAQGKLEKAAEYYKKLYSPENPRPSAEEKYAKIIVELAEGKRQQQLLKDMLENPSKYRQPSRNPLIAAVLSLAPGFGQIYNGQLKKGVWIFCASVICWILIYYMQPNVANFPPEKRAAAFVTGLDPLAIAIIAIGSCISVYAVIDAAISAKNKTKSNELGS
jgi:tetratricopeptide (TPR) repeat protein